MQQRQLIVYIAASLDGYIAKADGDLGWLSAVEAPPEDYGYAAFTQTVDTVIMGRKTYEKVLGFGIPWPHKGRKCYVLSTTRTGANEDVEFFSGDPSDLLETIRKGPGMNIYCDGGGRVVQAFAQRDLIDRYVVSVIPVLLGDGIPLFLPGRPEQKLRLVQSIAFPTGLVQLHYEREKG